jgi:hypothetical protein
MQLCGVDFNCKVGTTKFTLHTLNAGFKLLDFGHKTFHFQNMGRTKLNANIAAFTIFFDYFDLGGAHDGYFLL